MGFNNNGLEVPPLPEHTNLFFPLSVRTPEQSAHARDAMAKALYAATFAWVVAHTNKSIQGDGASAAAVAAADGVTGAPAGVSAGTEFNTDKMYEPCALRTVGGRLFTPCLSTAAQSSGQILETCCHFGAPGP